MGVRERIWAFLLRYELLLQVLRKTTIISGIISLVMGLFYLGWWYWTGGANPQGIGIAYPGSFAFILMGLGIVALFSPGFQIYSMCVGALLCLLSLVQAVYLFFLTGSFLDQYDFFISRPNPLNLMGFFLVGSLFLIWNKRNPRQFHYIYGLFVSLLSTGMAILGLLAYYLGFSAVYGNTHLFGMITLIIVSLGIFCGVVYYEKKSENILYKWIPHTVGLTLIIFASFLSFGLYLNKQLSDKLTSLFIVYSFVGGILFVAASSLLVYFYLLSRERLNRLLLVQQHEKEALEAAQVGTWRWDTQLDRVEADKVACYLCGIDQDKLDRSLEEMIEAIHVDDRANFQSIISNSLRTQEAYKIEFRVIWKDLTIHFMQMSGGYTPEGGRVFLTGTIFEITKSKYAEQLLTVSEGAAKAFLQHGSIDKLASQLIDLLYQVFEWELITIWREDDQGHLVQVSSGQSSGFTRPDFVEAIKGHSLQNKTYIVKEVSKSLQPFAVADLSVENRDTRHSIAQECNIHGAVFFPLLNGMKVKGYVELFKSAPLSAEMDQNIAYVLTAIGSGIESYIREKEANHNAQAYAKIVSLSQTPIYSCTVDGTILSWNDACQELFGWKAEEAIGKKLDILFFDNQSQELEELKGLFYSGLGKDPFRSERKTKGGTVLSVEERYSILKSDSGTEKVAVYVLDMSKEEALTLVEEKLRIFFDSTDDWIWEIDQEGKFTTSNPAVYNILGFEDREVLGKPIGFSMTTEAKEEFDQLFQSCVLGRHGWAHHIFSCKNKNGDLHVIESSAFPIFDRDQNLVGFQGSDRDVTLREEVQKQKNEFISIISHEVKTPLTAIHGALGLLVQDQKLSEESHGLVDVAQRNSERLRNLMLDLIDVEKMELGKVEFQLEEINIEQVIQEAVEAILPTAHESNITIEVDDIDSKTMVIADKARLVQVLLNLLSNAIKFSAHGRKVRISTRQVENRIQVSVVDQGVGVPEHFKNKVFERFERLASREEQGSGLGLNIAQAIIERLGGKIAFTSEEGKGSNFYFELPMVEENKNEAA